MSRIHTCLGLTAAVLSLQQAFAAEAWQHITKPVLPSDEIQLIKSTEKGVVWVGTPDGAARIENGVCAFVKPSKGLKVWDVAKRPEGGYWIGHSSGILLVDGERTVKALSGVNVGSIQPFGKGFWCIAKDESKDRNTIMRSKGEEWEAVPELKNRRVLDLDRDSKGIFWVRLDGDGVLEIDSAKPLTEAKPHLARMNVTSVMTDSKGNTWCGLMSEGIMVRMGSEWKRVLDKEKTAVTTILEDGAGQIWAATSGNGAWTFDGKAWTGRLQKEGPVNILKMSADKRIWISTSQVGGLRYWDGKEWKGSLETPMPVNQLIEPAPDALLAGTILDGLYVSGNFSIKGE